MSASQTLVNTRPQPSKSYRWLVLIFVSVAMFGNYYVYDSINPLERIFLQQLNYSASMFGWLNASYSVAAVATLLIGGILIDRFGIRKSLMLFSVLILLGALLTSLKGNFYLMVSGRALVGLGAESQIVAVTTALARWFKGKELSFAFGINLTIARIASIAADNSPTWAKFAFFPNGVDAQPSWHRPLVLAVVVGSTAVIGALVYWGLETYAETRYHLGKSTEPDKLSFREGLKFNPSYWYVVALCFTFYSGIFPFRTFAIDLFTSKYLVADGCGCKLDRSFRFGPAKGRLAEQSASFFGDDRNASVRLARRPHRQTRNFNGRRIIPDDAGVPADRLQQYFAAGAGVDDGNCLLADSGGDVAFGRLHRG